jgi:hypothetical protein
MQVGATRWVALCPGATRWVALCPGATRWGVSTPGQAPPSPPARYPAGQKETSGALTPEVSFQRGGEAPPRPYQVPYGKTGAGAVGTGRGAGATRVPVCTRTGPCSVVSPFIESCSSL